MQRSLLLFFSLLAMNAFSQTEIDSLEIQDAVILIDSVEVAVAEEEMMYKEDEEVFYFYESSRPFEYVPGEDHPDLVRDRLFCLEQSIPLEYNDRVHAFINYFTVKDREYTRLMMRRQNLYFPLFEKHLAKYNMPDELKYLSIIESALNPRAISRASAVGLWQFMSATGRFYGLYQDWYTDDRMDPEKSTDAACRYLRDLYRMFNDWELALAAYNTGPGNVKKAIRKSGYKKGFWEIYPFLPRETRSYVPQFVAMIYTMNYLDEHNFIDDGEEMLMPYDTLEIKQYLHFETFANLTGICIEDLQKLNPRVRHNALPESTKPHILRVPVIAKQALEADRIAILDSASKVGKKEVELLAQNLPGSTYARDRVIYKVKSGDVLGSIALRHGVKVEDIKKWNNLSSNTIHIGQRLNIWLKPSAAPAVVASAPNTPKTSVPVAVPDSKTYVVQPGDTLWDISRKFEGLSIEKLKTLNNLSNNKIHVGQKLIVGL